ncbi:unnamed protein product, partial [Cladocopium goreaui]
VPSPLGRTLKLMLGFHPIRAQADQMTKPESVFKGTQFGASHNSSRKFRTAFAALSDEPGSPSANEMLKSSSGYSSSSAAHIEDVLNSCLRGLDRSRCLVVTSGARWTGRQPSFPGAKVLQIDCRHFHDPDNDRSIRGCTGRHPSIIRGVAYHEAMNDLVEQVTNFLRANPNGKLVIHLYCTSGRHRSVGLATLIYYFLDVTDWREPLLIHYHSPEWREMTCGGHCSLCATADTRELRDLMNRAYYNGDEIFPHVDTSQDRASSSPCMFQHIHLQAAVLETHLVEEEYITKEIVMTEIMDEIEMTEIMNEAEMPETMAVIMEDKTDQKEILFERQAWSAISKQTPYAISKGTFSKDPSITTEEQQPQGIRVDIKLRSHVRSTLLSGGRWMRQQGWVRSSFYRPRDSTGTSWNRLQREEAVGENVDLPTTWADLVIFSHRDVRPRAYTGRVVLLSGGQGMKLEPQKGRKAAPKSEPQRQHHKDPPVPPQPSRFMICTDDDMFKGDLKIQTPKTESTDYSTSSPDGSPVAKLVKSEPSNEKPCHEKTPKDEVIIKNEPGDVLPVGLMARDPDGPNMHEVVLDSVVIGGEQQSFLDARISQDSQSDGYEPSVLEAPEPIAADPVLKPNLRVKEGHRLCLPGANPLTQQTNLLLKHHSQHHHKPQGHNHGPIRMT